MTSLIMPPPHDSFLSACSCPVLVLHSGSQPFHIPMVGLEHYLAQTFFFFCLHMLTKLFNSDTICYNPCRWHCTWSIFHYSRMSSPQNFLFICLSFPAFFCLFIPAKSVAYIYSFFLSLFTLFDVSYLTVLEHRLSCLAGLFIAFCAVLFRITSFLSSSLKHSLTFEIWCSRKSSAPIIMVPAYHLCQCY